MGTARTRPTAADVARRSGVSTATVSYVLNRTTGQTISPETRAKVLRAADELGYVQHAAAQALARGASRIVVIDRGGIPHGDVAEHATAQLAESLRGRGFTPLLTPWNSGGSTDTLLELARAMAPHAVVTVAPLDPDARAQLSAAGVQAFGTLFPGPLRLDDMIARAAHAQVEFLAQQGHRGVLYMPATDPDLATLSALRGAAVSARASELGLRSQALDPTAIAGPLQRLTDALPSVLSRTGLTAIAAYHDEVAMRVLAALHRLQLPVPERVAVIGVDDLPLAELTVPALTSVRYVPDESLLWQNRAERADALAWLTQPSQPPAPASHSGCPTEPGAPAVPTDRTPLDDPDRSPSEAPHPVPTMCYQIVRRESA